MAQFGFAVEGAGVIGEGVHEFFGDVDDVLAAAALLVAKEGQDAVALGQPAVLGDDLGWGFGREIAVLVLPEQVTDEGGVEGDDAHGVVDAGADVADAHFDGGELAGGPDVPPEFAGVVDEVHALVVGDQAVEFGAGAEGARQAGAGEIGHEIEAEGLEAGFATFDEGRRRGQRVEDGQVAPDGGHDADARVGIAEAGVDVHAADQESTDAVLEGDDEALVAFAGRGGLFLPVGERVG